MTGSDTRTDPHIGPHGHHHAPGHTHDHETNATAQQPAMSLLQASALVRLAGAIALLIPLWIAVYGLVS